MSHPSRPLIIATTGAPHTFANRAERDARLHVTCAPADFARYFERLSTAIGGDPPEDAIRVGPPIGSSVEQKAGDGG